MLRTFTHFACFTAGIVTVWATVSQNWWAVILLLLTLFPWDKGLDTAASIAIEYKQMKDSANERAVLDRLVASGGVPSVIRHKAERSS